MVIFMNNKIYNIITKKYSNFIKINKNIDLGTYYNLYDEKNLKQNKNLKILNK